MIPVEPAAEPRDFDAKVRRRGLDAIAQLVGEAPSAVRRGPPRKKIADRREDIPPGMLPPLWRDALDDLMTAYRRLCAYTALYIEPATGAASVDHVVPKSRRWDRAYEWSNYRLACSLVNANKAASTDVLDPFEIRAGWFVLELVGFQVCPGKGLTPSVREQVLRTIDRLGLNDSRCRGQREAYATAFSEREISLSYLRRRAPFVAYELERQGRSSPPDSELG
ncbi:MAG: hypothetical protein AB1Z98_13905 [Nannocystaceae bacterium]